MNNVNFEYDDHIFTLSNLPISKVIPMKFFKKRYSCRNICSLYKAPETVTSEGVVNQYKCDICNEYVFPSGIENKVGNKICKCCGSTLSYISSIKDIVNNKNLEGISKKSFTRDTKGMKTFSQFQEFIEEGMSLNANYQLVALKILIGKKMATKMEIAEELAYQNNKNYQDINEIKKFLNVPVYDVLEKKGFIKKIHHDMKDKYILNVIMEGFEADAAIEIIESKLQNYNIENNIPENQFDPLQNDLKTSIEKNYEVNSQSNNLQTSKNFWIWSITKANWEILKNKNVWGSRIPNEKISKKVKKGDRVAFYVIGTNSFQGVFEFTSDWFDSPGKTWDDDLEPNGKLRYVSQIKILPIAVGLAELCELYENMDLFKDKPTNIRNLILQGGSGYPSNNAKSLSESDFQEIISAIKNHQESILIEESIPEVPESKNETITLIENSSTGIRLKEFSEIKSEEIFKGQILSNDDLINKLRVGNMGGIRYSKKNNILVLCSTLSDNYADSIDPNSGLCVYSGEGQIGDQELSKGNKKILDSECKMLFFKEKYQEPGARKRGALDNLYEFIGPVNYVKHFWIDEKDKEGNSRKVVKFVLEVEE